MQLQPTIVRARAAAVVLAAAATVVTFSAVSSDAPPHAAPANEKVKVVADGDDGLYVVNGDGSGMRRITRGMYDSAQEWSPDGRTILFVRDDDHVMLVRPDGSGLRSIGEGGAPRWSPDGSRILFGREDGSAVMLARRDGTGLRSLGKGTAPLWSPDGARVAYVGCAGYCVVDLARGTRRSIAAADANAGWDWSPDGRRIAYAGTGALKIVDLATAKRTKIPLPAQLRGAGDLDLYFSPDGERVAFAGRDGEEGLYLARIADGTVTRVADSWEPSFAWAPDSRQLAYTDACVYGHLPPPCSAATGNDVLYVLSLTTGHARRLTDPRFSVDHPQWTPDGKGIVFERERFPWVSPRDIWLAYPGAGARAITITPPSRIEWNSLEWPIPAPGSVALTPTPRSRAHVAPRPSATVTERREIVALAPAGRGVAFATGDCGANRFWLPGSSRLRSVLVDCEDADGIDLFAAAPGLSAYTYAEDTMSSKYSVLVADAPGHGSRAEVGDWDRDEDLGNLFGDGSLVVFQYWPPRNAPAKLYRIVADPRPRFELLGRVRATDNVVAVDAGRILLRRADGTLLILDSRARPLRTLPRLARPTDTVLLAGDEIAVQRKAVLSVYDARTGKLDSRTRLAGAAPQLASLRGNLAAYTSGVDLHILRLRERSDRILELAGSAARPLAAFSPRGLFVSYAVAGKVPPTRLLLIPLARLTP